MRIQIPDIAHVYSVLMIDGEFDRFELNRDLEMQLREAEIANFYHNALNEEA